jgi:hypothetical protein
VLGRTVRAEDPDLWAHVGHLVESATAYPELTVTENLGVARRLLGVRDPAVVTRAPPPSTLVPTAHVAVAVIVVPAPSALSNASRPVFAKPPPVVRQRFFIARRA